jgi:hypothetical protein
VDRSIAAEFAVASGRIPAECNVLNRIGEFPTDIYCSMVKGINENVPSLKSNVGVIADYQFGTIAVHYYLSFDGRRRITTWKPLRFHCAIASSAVFVPQVSDLSA